MAKVAIFEGERKKWIQYDADTEVLIKLIGKEELRDIMNKATKSARLTGVDISDFADARLCKAAVLGWRKIDDHDHPGLLFGEQEQPLPFTPENVSMLMKKSITFSKFVNEHAMNEAGFLQEDEDTKNG